MSINQLSRFRDENYTNQLKSEYANISTCLMAGLCHLWQLFGMGTGTVQQQLYEVVNRMVTDIG